MPKVSWGTVAFAILAFLAPARAQSGVRTVPFGERLNNGPNAPLVGFVDLHTHPLNHISFGGKVFHGAPDVGIWMPKAMRGCDTPAGEARNRDEALGDCSSIHEFVTTGCGNVWRGLGVFFLELENKAQQAHGAPARSNKKSWPAHDDITHQQMWVEWTERAYKGGLRVMVALVTNNKMLGDGVRGEDTDDVSTIKRAIPETIKWVNKHRWMEVARSAADVRRIVGQDKLAVILGVEVDDIGGMVDEARNGRRPSDNDVRAHIRSLHAMGVRYVLPLHVADNLFGGTAAYRSAFDLANRYMAGFYWALTCAKGYDFNHDVKAMTKLAAALNLHMDLSEGPNVASCKKGWGHVNRRGLTRRGEIAIDEMMRLGMLVDIDHMSHATIADTIELARNFHGGYPLVSGHSSLLDLTDANNDPDGYARREDKKLARHYQAIRELGGIVGIEWDSTSAVASAESFVAEVGRVMRFAGTSIAFGTDVNGMVVQPRPPNRRVVAYSPQFPKSKADPAKRDSREWDYNTDGVAHYGMLSDFLKHVEQIPAAPVRTQLIDGDIATIAPGAKAQVGGADVIDALYGGAEAFARTWERAEAKADAARRAPPPRLPANTHLIPSKIIGPLCPTRSTGGRDFGGHGPKFKASVKLRIVDGSQGMATALASGEVLGRSAIVANIAFEAQQTKLGRTHTKQAWDVVVANAPRGMRFEKILGPPDATEGRVEGVSGKGGFQFIVVRHPQPAMWLTPDSGRAVDEFLIVGDTGGVDISDDEDCRDDTSVTVALNPIRVQVAPIDDPIIDAVEIRITTGEDDVRGGAGSAIVQVHFDGGQSAEIDLTSHAKRKHQSGTVRVPLGRSIRVSALRSLALRHTSNKCLLCKPDRWIVQSMRVTAAGAGSLLSISRFEISDATRTFSFR